MTSLDMILPEYRSAVQEKIKEYSVYNQKSRAFGVQVYGFQPFEIYLINKGYTLDRFCSLSTYEPSRSYTKGDKWFTIQVSIGCYTLHPDGQKTKLPDHTINFGPLGLMRMPKDEREFELAENKKLEFV